MSRLAQPTARPASRPALPRPPQAGGTPRATPAALRPASLRHVPAVTRAVAILRLLGKAEAPLGVLAIAQALDIVPSTCLHILRVLVAEELVAFDAATKHYALSAGILAIARRILGQHSLSEAMQPHVDALARRFGVTAAGVEASGLAHMVVVAISRAESGLRLHVDIGSRYPALISATGRCIAAFGGHDWAELQARFAKLRWDNPPTFAEWRADVEQTRIAGYAVDDGRYIAGVAIIAAPVQAGRGVRHCLVVVGVREQLQRIGYAMIGETVRSAAAELSRNVADGA